ncbi:MAG TPA: hypothetical protein VN911_06055 [Candidatus Acidoferrum sp.]|nr:hypothetical protein [Candidatus Acidoferrum sp.]
MSSEHGVDGHENWGQVMQIGKPVRTLVVEPLELKLPAEQPDSEPEKLTPSPQPAHEPEQVSDKQ